MLVYRSVPTSASQPGALKWHFLAPSFLEFDWWKIVPSTLYLGVGQSPPVPHNPALQPLRARQVAALRDEQRRGACAAAALRAAHAPVLCDCEGGVW